MIHNISVLKLRSHPHNPRKDLGDLTELAASIKANGIFQNLTVVPLKPGYCPSCGLYNNSAGNCIEGHDKTERAPCSKWKDKGLYTVIIGHRRLAAAQLAGLDTVPCAIAEMDERTQIATMLLENIQRSDLSVLEQADGFQMMLKLGDTVSGISKQTGFSETTIRHRIRLSDLKRDKLEAAAARGGTIQDYVALEQIKDSTLKHKALEAIGTHNFKWQMEQCIEEEAKGVRKKEMLEWLGDWASKVKNQPDKTSFVRCFHSFKLDGFKKPKDASKTEYFYTVESYGITLYKTADAPEKKEKTEVEKLYSKRESELKKLSKRAYELRCAFMKGFGAAKKHSTQIYAFAFSRLTQYSHADLNNILKLLDIEKPEGEDYISEVQDAKRKLIFERYHEHPEKTMLLVAYACFSDGPSNDYFSAQSWQSKIAHEKNSRLDALYDTLIELGYEMSDEERALQDGTHELFATEENEKAGA